MSNKLSVFWDMEKVGELSLETNRQFLFHYSENWLARPDKLPISLSLPLRKASFSGGAVRAFFSNLLPESRVKEQIARRLGVSLRNDFALLEALAGDCAGALSLLPEGQSPDSSGDYEPLPPKNLGKIIDEMPNRPLLFAGEGLRLSLAGAQDKLPIFVEDGKFYIPRGTKPSSHILKPPIPEFETSVPNEVFCMKCAGRLGIPVPRVQMWEGTKPLFLIERYDRIKDSAGHLHRIHQEDMCQALGVGYDQKYETEGGPSLRDCFRVIDDFCREPVSDKRRLLQWTIFNILIGNHDAHGKNVSLLIKKDGICLAPFYDILSTAVYPEISQELAMKIGGENRVKWLRKEHWFTLAEEAHVSPKAIVQLTGDMVKALPAALDWAKKEVEKKSEESGIIDKIISHMKRVTEQLRLTFEDSAKPS